MRTTQMAFSMPTHSYSCQVGPDGDGYGWSVFQYDQGERRFVILDSGWSPHLAVALSDVGMCWSVLAEGCF